MSKKNSIKRLDEIEGDEAPLTMDKVANEIFGLQADANRFDRNVMKIKLDDIVPDFAQPRRLIPRHIRGNWRGEPDMVGEILNRWRVEAEKELGRPIDVIRLIDHAGDGNEADGMLNPKAHNFLALVGLAGSIKRDGLEHPVSVVGRSGRRKLVAGERRYWAYQLLRLWYGDKWDSIPAAIVDKANVWRQAAENGAREELNAISKARQLALLLMDMYEGDDGVMFNDIEFFDHEQGFYAQVADGNKYRVKSGMGERVLQVMGFRDPKYLYHIRNLLKIPRDLWDTADAENWTENRIRETLKPRETSTVVDVYTPENKVSSVHTSTIVDVPPAPQPFGAYLQFKTAMMNWLESNVRESAQQMGFMGRDKDVMYFVYWERGDYRYEKKAHHSAWMGAEKNVDKLIMDMYQIQPSLDKWLLMPKSQWSAMGNPPKRASSDDDRKQKQQSRFGELMGGQLVTISEKWKAYGMYTRIGNVFVWWRDDKQAYEVLRAGVADEHHKKLYQLDDVVGIMFGYCPDYWTWKQISKDQFEKTLIQVSDTSPLKLSPTPRPEWERDDDEYIDDDVRHPFGGSDMDDEQALALHEQDIIDREIANYKANNPPTSQPPKDFDNPLVFGNDTLEYALALVIMKIAERDNNAQIKHVANMLCKMTKYEIANWHGNWSDVVGDWFEGFSGFVADVVIRMFNRLDELGNP